MLKKLLDTMGNQQPSVVGNSCEGSTTIEMPVQDRVEAYIRRQETEMHFSDDIV